MNLVLQLAHGIIAFHAGCFSFLQQALGVICEPLRMRSTFHTKRGW